MALVSMPPCHSATGDAVNTEGLLNKKRASIQYPDGKYQLPYSLLPISFNSVHEHEQLWHHAQFMLLSLTLCTALTSFYFTI
jgi:hypothetical protein